MPLFNKHEKYSRYGRIFSAILQHCRSATLIAMLPALLSGCMGIYEGGFECSAGTGVGCKSISEVNSMVDQGELPKLQIEPPTPINYEIWYAPRSSVQYSVSGVQKNSSINLGKGSPSTIEQQNHENIKGAALYAPKSR